MTLSRTVLVTLSIASPLVGPPAAHSESDATVQSLLEKARKGIGRTKAAGAPDAARSIIMLSGTTRFLGSGAKATVSFDPAGNYKTEIDGPVSFARGIANGKGWCHDLGGEVHPLYFGELEPMLVESSLVTGSWTDSPAFEFAALPDKQTDAADVLAFTLRNGRLKGEINLDKGTGRPTLVRFGAGPEVRTITLSGELIVDGAWYPARAELGEPSGFTTTQSFEHAQRVPAASASFDPPAENLNDREFDASIPAEIEVKRVKSGHLLVRPRINGQDAGWWFFDTGAGGAVISPAMIDKLGLERFGEIPVGGMGGTSSMPMVRPHSVTLGPITYHDLMMTQVDLAPIGAALGEEIVGAIGYNLLHRCIVRVDQNAPKVAIYDPAKFDGSAPGGAGLNWSKLYVYERHPCIDASFEGRAGVFKIDTGAGSQTVMFHSPAVVRHKLLDRETSDSKGGGVGGYKAVKVGTLDWFEFGGVRQDQVKATFSLAADGTSAEAWADGAIGGKLLTPFELVLDYKNERIALVKVR